jgi:gas vesicle protein
MKVLHNRRVTFLVAGVGLGVLAALLLTPRSGKEIRHTLRRGTDEGLTRLRRDSQKFRLTASSWLARMRAVFCDGSQPPR